MDINVIINRIMGNSSAAGATVGESIDMESRSRRLGKIKILSWMKLQVQLKTPRPLRLQENSEWSEAVLEIIRKSDGLNGILIVEGHDVIFSPEVSDERRASILGIVERDYNPPLMK